MIIQPRPFNPRKTITVLAVLCVALYFYYQRPPPLQFWKMSGSTMGTQYSIRFTDHRLSQVEIQKLKIDIDALLAEVNRQMSTYLPDSEISRFNKSDSTEPFPVAPGFSSVARLAENICFATAGAFNPTLDHLINAWGFGPQGPRKEPDEAELQQALQLVGCGKVSIEPDGALKKPDPRVTLNLNAIAKGWGVDEVVRLMRDRGITNLFVEIGGEVYAAGQSEKLRPWRVGIDRPQEGALPGEAFDLVVELDGAAMATSGDYRSFHVTKEGRKLTHILDPRTGRPTTSSLASVSVIASNCALADALATALFVMGAEEGRSWVESYPGVEAAFIEHVSDDLLNTVMSSGFTNYLLED